VVQGNPINNINRFVLQELGSIRKYSPIILVSTEGYILGLIGVPHIRKLCGNTKIIRRVFADKLVVYSYYQNFLTLSTSSNPVLEKENQHLLYVMFDRQFF